MRTVLIVDDDEDLRLVLEEFVAVLSGGTAVLAASLDEVRRRREDALASSLAIVDINLGPDEPTGVEVVTWLKSQGYRGSIVFLTGHASDDPAVVTAARVTNTRLFEKPLSSTELARLLAGAPVAA